MSEDSHSLSNNISLLTVIRGSPQNAHETFLFTLRKRGSVCEEHQNLQCTSSLSAEDTDCNAVSMYLCPMKCTVLWVAYLRKKNICTKR